MKDDGAEFNLGSLPEDIAEVQRSAVESPGRLRHARARLLVSLQNRRATGRKRARAWLLPLVATLAIAVAATALAFILVREESLRFEVGNERAQGEAGALVRAPANATLPVRFSDGSLISARPGSGLRIAEVEADGAVVVLEDGTLEASVVHRARSRWRVQAGPYAVVVTGTRFVVRWNASERSFALQLHEGSVTVFGPTFGDQGRALAAGERLEVTAHATVPSVLSADVAGAATSVPPSSAKPSTPPRIAPSSTTVAPAPTSKPSWKDLALAGQHRSAFVAAEAEGFGTICGAASPADLLLLGNTARFAQEPRRAQEAFRTLRARQDGRYQRAVAAFELGRLAHDQFRAYSEAASWFERYLAEEPSGALVREAAGRLVEARHKAGDRAGARKAARVYLERYPDGPHDKLARALLGP